MPPIYQLFEVAREYNKNLYELSLGDKTYAIVSELKKSLERVTKLVASIPKVNLDGKVTTVVRTFEYDITNPPKATEIALKDLIALSLAELTALETEINAKRAELQKEIAKYGVNVSNLVSGDNEGSYVTGGKTKAETKVEDDTIQIDVNARTTVVNSVEYAQERIAPWIELNSATKKELSKISDKLALDKLIEDINCRKG